MHLIGFQNKRSPGEKLDQIMSQLGQITRVTRITTFIQDHDGNIFVAADGTDYEDVREARMKLAMALGVGTGRPQEHIKFLEPREGSH